MLRQQAREGKKVIEVLKEISRDEDKALLTKRQIVFFGESIKLKRQKGARSEKEHKVAVRAAKVRKKKDSIELLVTLQKNLREMR
ncbi:hypothetical protein PR003_g9148 [Phytophthora rubi]|uniref:Uncharacterized protein n=1 Tax=Phytophthora rubi TaxID=129364 RepID=A0A6A3NQ69_9STRA|nr:hypothetical protein PR002_g10153 [Phytophthora rubi]KAE9044626.1 hypothetical protein PR001_g5294 [Phytophthora rubi]KAE9343082.1 hypothetical protein PR003_g9148 [Phytophthora rubi]